MCSQSSDNPSPTPQPSSSAGRKANTFKSIRNRPGFLLPSHELLAPRNARAGRDPRNHQVPLSCSHLGSPKPRDRVLLKVTQQGRDSWSIPLLHSIHFSEDTRKENVGEAVAYSGLFLLYTCSEGSPVPPQGSALGPHLATGTASSSPSIKDDFAQKGDYQEPP